MLAVECDRDTGCSRSPEGLDCGHSRALQPSPLLFSGVDWRCEFASTPSASSFSLPFSDLARTVGGDCGPEPSARPSAPAPTVRGSSCAKLLLPFSFGPLADGADDADGRAPALSGLETMWIVRTRPRP